MDRDSGSGLLLGSTRPPPAPRENGLGRSALQIHVAARS